MQPVTVNTRPRPSGQAPSPARHAITLLIQHPSLAQQVEDAARLKALGLPGVELLSELIELLHQQPNLTTAAVIEHWRDIPAGNHLSKLAMVALNIPEEGLDEEFTDTLDRLEEQHIEQRTEALLENSRLGSLSDAEKSELQQLLGARRR